MTKNCIHTIYGLCPDCQAEYDTCSVSWEEAGYHPAGISSMRDLEAELAAREPGPTVEQMRDWPF
jgi:hypothetical protein